MAQRLTIADLLAMKPTGVSTAPPPVAPYNLGAAPTGGAGSWPTPALPTRAPVSSAPKPIVTPNVIPGTGTTYFYPQNQAPGVLERLYPGGVPAGLISPVNVPDLYAAQGTSPAGGILGAPVAPGVPPYAARDERPTDYWIGSSGQPIYAAPGTTPPPATRQMQRWEVTQWHDSGTLPNRPAPVGGIPPLGTPIPGAPALPGTGNVPTLAPGPELAVAERQAASAAEIQSMRDAVSREQMQVDRDLAEITRKMEAEKLAAQTAYQTGNLDELKRRNLILEALDRDRYDLENRQYTSSLELQRAEQALQTEIQRGQLGVQQGQLGVQQGGLALNRSQFLAQLLSNPPAILQRARALTPELVNFIEGQDVPFQWLLENRTLAPAPVR